MIADMFYILASTTVKLSVLSYFARIFGAEVMKDFSQIMDVLVVLWVTMCSGALLGTCDRDFVCKRHQKVNNFIGSTDLLVDLVLFLVPFSMLFIPGIRLKSRAKLAFFVLLIIGYVELPDIFVTYCGKAKT